MISQTAIEMFHKNNAFSMYVRSAVHEAMQCVILENTDSEVRELCHGIATQSVIIALKRAFDNDAEISRLWIENEHYKKLALNGFRMTPPTWSVQND